MHDKSVLAMIYQFSLKHIITNKHVKFELLISRTHNISSIQQLVGTKLTNHNKLKNKQQNRKINTIHNIQI